MSDPNGEAAGAAFLEANGKKDGVITLPSGLQYRVIEEGAGLEHPTVSTPCECHYAGRLLDGSEFDSSYKRGNPSTFAPNQVIKGWTEAMQLMVQGDKWEMFIPWPLAYGANGKPPKIPAKACLIFIMEIVKIKGPATPRTAPFPEWTEQELALWKAEDEAACQKWKDTRSAAYEKGDEKLTSAHPTREGFDAWLEKQCKSSKDKSLWRRTRAAKKKALKAASAATAAAPAAPPAGPPALTVDKARALLDKALATFKVDSNKAELKAIVEEVGKAPPESQMMMRMARLMPVCTKMLSPVLTEFGFGPDDLMTVATQLMSFGSQDPTIMADTQKLMSAAQGDLSAFED